MIDREKLGQIVRETWVRWARKQPNPKPHHLIPWEELDEDNKEVDRLIGEAVMRHCRAQIPDVHPLAPDGPIEPPHGFAIYPDGTRQLVKLHDRVLRWRGFDGT